MARARPRSSLKAKALQLLALREQSRLELRRKLLRHAAADAAAAAAAASVAGERSRGDGGARGEGDAPSEDEGASPAARAAAVDAVLDWLAERGYLSEERFVESRVNARAARFGNLRIRHELAQHGAALPLEAEQALAASEAQRAATVRARRFAAPPADAKERAAQERFLLGRGFSPDTVRRLLRSL